MKIVSLSEAADQIQANQRVFVQGAAMTPNTLINKICERYEELSGIEIVSLHTDGKVLYAIPPYNRSFQINSFFVAENIRAAVDTLQGDYIPIFLSEIHLLFKRDILPLDIAIIQVSPPDKHGFCSLGVSVDITLAALKYAKKVIAQVNPQVPQTHGDGIIHQSRIDFATEVDEPIHVHLMNEISESDAEIGKHVAGLIEDGATLQLGIGDIPNAVLSNLGGHKRLGIHTELFSDGILPLVESGVITGEEKNIKPGKIVGCISFGSKKLYDFLDDNPSVHFKEAAYTNNTALIVRNPKVTAINSAIEIDLTGQVCADTIGLRQFSGVGGQMDFIRGASLSEGGKPIIALSSVTKNGVSKITPVLKEGAGVTTTRAHVHYVVTENGVVNLYGKNLYERAKALISIAHPDHQEALDRAAFERFGRS